MDHSNFLNWITVFFLNIDEFFTQEYVNKENRFVRKRKISKEDLIFYILVQKGRTNAIEAYNFVKNYMVNKKDLKLCLNDFNVTRQAIGKQRKFICPLIFFMMNNKFIDKIYEDLKGLKQYNGYLLFAIDGSELKLPNKEITKKEFKLKINSLVRKILARSKISCVVDSNSQFIIDILVEIPGFSEPKLAIEHLKRLKKRRFDFKKCIFIFDRGYNSNELILQLLVMDANFVIRLQKDKFKKERLKMRTNDEFVKIPIKKLKPRSLKDPKLLKLIAANQFLYLRITETKLVNGEKEILLSTLSVDEFTTADLKEIYNRRWKIETVYDFLKNTIQVENFTGYREIIIMQDLYASILFYNISNAIKLYTVNILRKNKKLKKDYSVSFNFTCGILKVDLIELILAETKDEKLRILENMVNFISKNKIKINTTQRKDTESVNSDLSNKFHMNRRIATL